MEVYHLVNVYITNWKDPPFFMGKSTLCMAISIAMLVYQRVTSYIYIYIYDWFGRIKEWSPAIKVYPCLSSWGTTVTIQLGNQRSSPPLSRASGTEIEEAERPPVMRQDHGAYGIHRGRLQQFPQLPPMIPELSTIIPWLFHCHVYCSIISLQHITFRSPY